MIWSSNEVVLSAAVSKARCELLKLGFKTNEDEQVFSAKGKLKQVHDNHTNYVW